MPRGPGHNGRMSPHLHAADFAGLDPRTAYLLWQLRCDVFVVEQDCPYPDLDGRDLEPGTLHLWAEADGVPIGCLRILDDGDVARIGRVAVRPEHRGAGVAGALMEAAIERIGHRASVLDAQAHLGHWYARFGYRRAGEDFLEDGIPHTPMRREPTPRS